MLKKSLLIKTWIEISAIVFVCILLFNLIQHADKSLTNLDNTVVSANNTLEAINNPEHGTLVVTNNILASLRLTVADTNDILGKERQQIDTLNHQEAVLFADAHETTQSLNNTLYASQQTLDALTTNSNTLNQTFLKLPGMVDELATTTASLNSLVSNSAIPTTLQNFSDTSKHLNNIADNAEKVSDHYTKEIVDAKKLTGWQKFKAAMQLAWEAAVLFK